MSAGLIGTIISVALAVFGWWIKWRMNRARKDREAAEQAKSDYNGLKKLTAGEMLERKEREKRLIEIVSGPGDARSGELLGRKARTPKDARPASS